MTGDPHFMDSSSDRLTAFFLLVHLGESRSREREVSAPDSSVRYFRRGVVEREPFRIHSSPSVMNCVIRSLISSVRSCSVLHGNSDLMMDVSERDDSGGERDVSGSDLMAGGGEKKAGSGSVFSPNGGEEEEEEEEKVVSKLDAAG